MAEIAIPAVALGAMYILSNRNEKNPTEGFDNVSAPQSRQLKMGNINTGVPANSKVNYPVQTFSDVGHQPSSYASPNAATDRYFQQEVYEKQVENNQDPTNGALFKSLNGDMVQKKDIKFNNMVPFFGSSVKQRTTNFNGNENLLDNYNGSGSQVIHKREQAPLFAPQENLHYAHGTPSHTDFIQSRMNPSRRMANTKPWEEIRVGPGLNKGYTNKGSDGFNAGMEARNKWLDKSVDQLRVKTNPKLTFSLGNHEGPANSTIKSRGIEGKIEKNRPDTFYINGPDRWFTTTGQEKAQRSRAEEPMQPENRPFTTREYFGAGTANQNGGSSGGRVEENYRKSTRPELAPNSKYLGPAHNLTYKTGGDNLKQNYGRNGYKTYGNSRTTTKQAREFGGAFGLLLVFFFAFTCSSSFIFSAELPSVSKMPLFKRNKSIGQNDSLFSFVFFFSSHVSSSTSSAALLSFFSLLTHNARIFANELPLVIPQFSNCSSLKLYTLVPSLFSYSGLAHTELFFGRPKDNIVNANPNPSFTCAATRTDVLVSAAAKSIAAVSEDTPINRALRPESNKFEIIASHGTA